MRILSGLKLRLLRAPAARGSWTASSETKADRRRRRPRGLRLPRHPGWGRDPLRQRLVHGTGGGGRQSWPWAGWSCAPSGASSGGSGAGWRFSYFLIGPSDPVGCAASPGHQVIVVSGFFMGSRYRAAVNELEGELRAAAEARVSASASATPTPAASSSYQRRPKVVGDARAPETWPAWLAEPHAEASFHPSSKPRTRSLSPRSPATSVGSAGIDLDRCRGREQHARVCSNSSLSSAKSRACSSRSARTYDLKTSTPAAPLGRRGVLQLEEGRQLLETPDLNWGDSRRRRGIWPMARRRHSPARRHSARFAACPEELLLCRQRRGRTAIWRSSDCVSALRHLRRCGRHGALRDLRPQPRAVNQLVPYLGGRAGDYSTRIPVKRKDQLGDLQRDVNQMAQHLQGLVATQAQKEAIEKELEIARRVQKSLLPSDPAKSAGPGAGVEFSTHFSPSAAIGGDYFDVLRMADGRLAVVIADVSGHGLSAGLRMAMLKAGLQILVEQGRDPEEILRRLDRLVRSSGEGRAFVTATWRCRSGEWAARADQRRPSADLSAPRRHLREIALLDRRSEAWWRRWAIWPERAPAPARRHRGLAPDGLIEATDKEAEPFGYECRPSDRRSHERRGHPRPVAARRGSALRRAPAEDDQTLVVMQFRPLARTSQQCRPSRAFLSARYSQEDPGRRRCARSGLWNACSRSCAISSLPLARCASSPLHSLAVLTLARHRRQHRHLHRGPCTLLRPLPSATGSRRASLGNHPTEPAPALYPDFSDLRTGATGFAGIAGYAFDRLVWTTADGSESTPRAFRRTSSPCSASSPSSGARSPKRRMLSAARATSLWSAIASGGASSEATPRYSAAPSSSTGCPCE